MEIIEFILKHFGIMCLILWIAIAIISVIIDTLFGNTKFIKKLKSILSKFSQYKVVDIIIRNIVTIVILSIIFDIISYFG